MAQEPDPLSFRYILGSLLLSVALMFFVTHATDVRVKTRDIDTVDLRHIEPKAEASSFHELIAQKPTEKAPEPVKEVVAETPPPAPAVAPEAPPVVEKPVELPLTSPSGSKAFIYHHESGNNPYSINRSSGACGIGQALPCSKMPCKLGDYACQDKFFTNYMLERYGSWERAEAYWKCIGRCTNKYGTITKEKTWW